MILYVTNIQWDYHNMYGLTEEEIESIPTRLKIEIDTDICESKEDIKTYYTMDVDEQCDIADCIDFDYSFLGFDLDITQWITTQTHHDAFNHQWIQY